MAGLVPAISLMDALARLSGIAGPSPAMTRGNSPRSSLPDSIVKQPRLRRSFGGQAGVANAAHAGLARYAPRQESSPVLFVEAPGSPVFSSSPNRGSGGVAPREKRGGRSAERRCRILSVPRSGKGARAPLGAPSRRFLIPGPRFQETPSGLYSSLGAPAQHLNALRRNEPCRRPVQRAPRRRIVVPNGSVPGTSRVRGDEPRPRAPHPAPSAERHRLTPLVARDADMSISS